MQQDLGPTGRGKSGFTAVAAVVAILRDGIRDGRWVPGQRMVEADLTEELGVGRGPVREALRILSGDGLVELIPHRGARIRRIGRDEAAHVHQVLGALQFLSADLLMNRSLSPADIAALRECNRAITAAVDRRDRAEMMRAALAYQAQCNAMSGNPYIDLAMRRLNVEYLSGAMALAMDTDTLVAALCRHGELTEAIAQRDADTARVIMQESYARVIDAFVP